MSLARGRVILFVQKKPSAEPKAYRNKAHLGWPYLVRMIVGREGTPGFSLANVPNGVMEARAAHRWWLIRCDSAASGRLCIEAGAKVNQSCYSDGEHVTVRQFMSHQDAYVSGYMFVGRVLATGVRA